MKTINPKVGRQYLYQGATIKISKVLDTKYILAENTMTGALEKVLLTRLKPLPDENDLSLDAESVLAEDDILTTSEEDWSKAQEKFEIIKPILENRGSLDLVEEVAQKSNVSRATIYRWIKLYEESGSIVSLVDDNKKKGGKGKTRLSKDADDILKKAIDDYYLTKQRRNVSKLIIEVKKQCRANNIEPPGDNTIRRRVQLISEEEKTRLRFGKKESDQMFKPLKGSFPGADFPLAIVQIDHTPVDIQLVDETYRKVIGRPWLTIAIDVYSRMVLGFYLSFDPPGSIGTALCIAHSILPKEIWLSKLNIQTDWSCWGVMRTIYLDNAREFKSKTLKRACEKYNINLSWRPVATPNFGGHIERLIGTLMKEVHSLPGTTFSNTKERGRYQSEKKASLTLKEFEKWFTTFITDVYHKRIHSSLGRRPIDVYEEGIFGNDHQPGTGLPERIYNHHQVNLDFMPLEERTIQDYGVMIDKIHYYDDVLRKYVNTIEIGSGKSRVKRKFIFKRDPRDISCVYFLDPDTNQYHRIPYRDTSLPSISVWEYRDAVKMVRDRGKETVDEEAIFKAVDEMRKVEMDAVQKTQKMTKARNRISESVNTTTIFYQNGEKITNVVNSNFDSISSSQEESPRKSKAAIKPFEGLDDE